jgi:PAS domain S-box-containing protein
MDFIFFIYGLAFILLIPTCLKLKRISKFRLSWGWLGLFGLLHGANQWLVMLAQSLGSNPAFESLRLVLLALSFALLAEFGRSSLIQRLGKGPGRWIFVPLLGVSVLGSLAGTAGLLASLRYGLGLVGGMGAAGALYLASEDSNNQSRPLKAAALSMAGYALATGVIVPAAPFFPASILNQDTFFAITGLPIQLVRGLLTAAISFSLWLVVLSAINEGQVIQTKVFERYLIFATLAGLTILIICGWLTTNSLGNYSAREEKIGQNQLAKLLEETLIHNVVEDADTMVKPMAGSPWVIAGLVYAKNDQVIRQVNSALDRYSQAIPSSVCFLTNLQGVIVASSNRNTPNTFVGQSILYRPYFQKAINGVAGGYFAVGTKNQDRGYYASFPVKNAQEKIIGVAVAKRSIAEFKELLDKQVFTFLIDPNGVVFLSSRPDLALKSLWPLPEEQRLELIASRQFGEGPFAPILEREPRNGEECLLEGKRLMVLRQSLPFQGWTIVTLSPMQSIALARLLGISVTMLCCSGLIGFLFVMDTTLESTSRLAASESLYRSLVQGSPGWVSLFDQEGRFLSINKYGRNIMGWREEYIHEKRFTEMWPQNFQPYVQEVIRRVVQGEMVTFEGDCLVPDGKGITWHVVLNPIIQENRTIQNFIGILIDISERKQVEKELQWELTVNKALSELSNGLISRRASLADLANIVLDHAQSLTRSEYGYVAYIHPQTAEVISYTLTEMRGHQGQLTGNNNKITLPL